MTSMLTLHDRVTVNDDVVFRVLGEESIILSLDTGLYFGLDPVGTRIWTLLAEHSLADVATTLQKEFDADQATIEQDVLALVEQLVAKKLVQRAP